MRATCPQCQRVITVPDEKIPAGKEVTVMCPACKGRINVSKTVGPSQPPADLGSRAISGEARYALCCAPSPSGDRIQEVLEKMGLWVARPSSREQGMELLRLGRVPLVVYQEGFDSDATKGLWGGLCSLSGEQRRMIFVVWVGKGILSGDSMLALSKSADLVVDEGDLGLLSDLLPKAQEEHSRFYRPLHGVLRELGLETSPLEQ